jgi:hypothetical protein
MTWVMTLFESDEWKLFLKKRTSLMQQFCTIRYIEKKTAEDVNSMYKQFYEQVG